MVHLPLRFLVVLLEGAAMFAVVELYLARYQEKQEEETREKRGSERVRNTENKKELGLLRNKKEGGPKRVQVVRIKCKLWWELSQACSAFSAAPTGRHLPRRLLASPHMQCTPWRHSPKQALSHELR